MDWVNEYTVVGNKVDSPLIASLVFGIIFVVLYAVLAFWVCRFMTNGGSYKACIPYIGVTLAIMIAFLICCFVALAAVAEQQTQLKVLDSFSKCLAQSSNQTYEQKDEQKRNLTLLAIGTAFGITIFISVVFEFIFMIRRDKEEPVKEEKPNAD